MSSEMFMLDDNLFQHLGPTIFSPDISGGNFFNHGHISTLSDSSIDSLLQEISSSDDHNNNNNNQNTTTNTTTLTTQISADHEVQSLDQIAHTLLSNSPPSHQLETLSLSQQQQQNLGNSSCNLGTGFGEYSSVSHQVKTEDFHLAFDSYLLSNSYNENESLVKLMQRSYSSNSFDGKPAGFVFQPRFDSFIETQNFQAMVGSPDIESSFSTSTGQMRRVCSTGDLPEVRMNQTAQQRICTSNTSTTTTGSFGEGNGSIMEEGNFKVGRYSAEERKERIDRYRAKRTQRNFNKTIKYACRKTLADNRPRIRGRFARNDETGEIPNKPTCFHPTYEDDDDLWVDNLQEEDEERMLGRGGGRFLSNFGGTQFQYCGY